MYPLSHKDHDSSSEERSPSASSSSSRDEGLEKGRSEDDFLQDLDDNETLIQFVVGLDSYLNRWLSIEVYEVQFFKTIFHPIRECMFELSFLTTLNIYKDYFKGRKR